MHLLQVAKRTFLISLLLTAASTSCLRSGWLDDGYRYMCPSCQDKAYLCITGECRICHNGTSYDAYKYCYDCAKERHCCQCCGIPRFFYRF